MAPMLSPYIEQEQLAKLLARINLDNLHKDISIMEKVEINEQKYSHRTPLKMWQVSTPWDIGLHIIGTAF